MLSNRKITNDIYNATNLQYISKYQNICYLYSAYENKDAFIVSGSEKKLSKKREG